MCIDFLLIMYCLWKEFHEGRICRTEIIAMTIMTVNSDFSGI